MRFPIFFITTVLMLVFGAGRLFAAPKAKAGKTIPRAVAADTLTRLQIFLDRENFGPGRLDGHGGEFTAKAIARYQRAHDLPVTGLPESSLPLDTVTEIYTTYEITAEDEKNIGPVPTQPPEQAKLKKLPYTSLLEFLGERFHSEPEFLVKLNRGKNMNALKPGDSVRVPNVEPFKIEDITEIAKLPERPEFAARSIYINPKEKMLDLYDDKKLIASFPITPGSGTLPAPQGVWMIVDIAQLPTFRWDKAMLNHGKRSSDFHNLPPGPNNPVGVLWAALNKTGIGIHGTNSPDSIGRQRATVAFVSRIGTPTSWGR